MSISIICLNDKNKPKEIPEKQWVKEGEWYTLDHIYWHPNQKCQGFGLREIYLDEKCAPYETYKGNRFGIRP